MYIWREIQKMGIVGMYIFCNFYYGFCYKYCAVKIRRNAKNVFNLRRKTKMKQKRRKRANLSFTQLFTKSWNFGAGNSISAILKLFGLRTVYNKNY